ncbi:hypothetical protein UYO_1238 [Lachnospiraceae bacterium JC7]|nr:hypothetical protein UYO_1238 [Lachnospiraceae bacterium JC7]
MRRVISKFILASLVGASLSGCGVINRFTGSSDSEFAKIEPVTAGSKIHDSKRSEDILLKVKSALDDEAELMTQDEALELEYTKDDEKHKVIKYRTRKLHDGNAYISKDIYTTLNDIDKEGHVVEYILSDRVTHTKEVIGSKSDLNKKDWEKGISVVEPSDIVNSEFKLILERADIDNSVVSVVDKGGEELYSVNSLIGIEDALKIMGLSPDAFGLSKDELGDYKCTISVYADMEDYSIAGYDFNLAGFFERYYEKAGRIENYDVTLCKFTNAINYSDRYSQIVMDRF